MQPFCIQAAQPQEVRNLACLNAMDEVYSKNMINIKRKREPERSNVVLKRVPERSNVQLPTRLAGGRPVHVAFMVDNSKSMASRDVVTDGNSRTSRSEAVYNAISEFIDGQENIGIQCANMTGAFVSIILFDDIVRSSRGPVDLKAARKEVKDLSSIPPKFGGKYGMAFNGLASVLDTEPRAKDWTNVGVLLTDGKPGDTSSFFVPLGLQLKKRYGVEFQLISFGTEGGSVMKMLTKSLNGTHHEASFAKQEIISTFQHISAHCSTLRGDVSLTLRTDIQREAASCSFGGTPFAKSVTSRRHAWLVMRENDGSQGWKLRGHTKVRLHEGCFAEGGLRLAFRMFVPQKSGELHLVLKQSKFESKAGTQTIENFHTEFLEVHNVSKQFAKDYNHARKGAFTRALGKLSDVAKPGSVDAEVALVILDDATIALQGMQLSVTVPQGAVSTVIAWTSHTSSLVATRARELVASVQAPRTGGSIDFVSAYVMCLAKEDAVVDPANPPAVDTADDAFSFVTVETFLEGNYVKLNSNDGYVNYDVPYDLISEAAAFSHFTFVQSKGNLIVVDIQGVGRKWTDPQVHSTSKCFGGADLGEEGMRKFFRSHVCGKVCKLLKLEPVHPETLKPRSEDDDVEEPEEKECVICLSTPRSIVCRPCGHYCLCVGCADSLSGKAAMRCPLCSSSLQEAVHIRGPSVDTFLRPSALDRAINIGNPSKKQRPGE